MSTYSELSLTYLFASNWKSYIIENKELAFLIFNH